MTHFSSNFNIALISNYSYRDKDENVFYNNESKFPAFVVGSSVSGLSHGPQKCTEMGCVGATRLSVLDDTSNIDSGFAISTPIMCVVDHVGDLLLPKSYPQTISDLMQAHVERGKIPGRAAALASSAVGDKEKNTELSVPMENIDLSVACIHGVVEEPDNQTGTFRSETRNDEEQITRSSDGENTIRTISMPSANSSAKVIDKKFPLKYLPSLSQELRIGSVVRRQAEGREKRKILTEKRLAEEAELEHLRKESWLAVPKRRRGILLSCCKRGCGSMFFTATFYR